MRRDRRDFLKSTLAASGLVSFGAATVPGFLGRSARAAAVEGGANGRILVVVQLLGGNDGLNTVVPHGLDGYARARRALRLPTAQLHPLSKEIGLHPSLGGIAKLIAGGKASVVQGVGYPNPDRSHFRSMEIWESARMEPDAVETGWIGRALDARPPKPGGDLPALHLGGRALPIASRARRGEVPTIASLDDYRLKLEGDDAGRREARDTLDGLARLDRGQDDPLLGFLRRSAVAAYESSRRLDALAPETPGKASSYPDSGLAKRLGMVARLIKAGFGTTIYYTALDGFDTHARQLTTHAALLAELSDAIAAFHADLEGAGQADRVALLTFSEFGRRVAENASMGTDHGAAAPLFVVGPVATPGLVGAHPSLEALDDGDLVHHTDFRRVYATMLERWLGLPSAPILGDGFAPLDLMATPS